MLLQYRRFAQLLLGPSLRSLVRDTDNVNTSRDGRDRVPRGSRRRAGDRAGRRTRAHALTIRTGPRPLSLLEQLARAGAERRRDTPDGVELGVGGFVLDLRDQRLVEAGIGRERLLAASLTNRLRAINGIVNVLEAGKAVHSGMTRFRMLAVGITGALAAAVCCFTPILVALLGAVGLSAATGYLDYVLLPAIAIFIAISIYAYRRRKPA